MQIETKELHGGTQKLYRFANGFGASVVSHRYSYGGERGLWELAVIQYTGADWKIAYDTGITSDVLGYLSADDVTSYLSQIEALTAILPEV